MIITGTQLDSLRADSLRKFEDEMLAHVKQYFVNHYKAIGEPALRRSIRYGYARARRYGMRSVRNVCMYLNNMVLLGSNFDIDPQYPWAAELLGATDRSADARMDALSDHTLAFIGRIGGPNNMHIFRSLLNLVQNSSAVYEQLQVAGPSELLEVFRELYPQKVDAVGAEGLRQLIALGSRNARKYGMESWPAMAVYSLFMFTMGAGFDEDPQFPWAAEILRAPEPAAGLERAARLFRAAVNHLKTAIDQYEK